MNRCEQMIGVQLGACRSRPLQGPPRLAASLHIPLIGDAPQGLILVQPLELCAVLPGVPDKAQAELKPAARQQPEGRLGVAIGYRRLGRPPAF
jgi:hypothetical protein